MYYLELVLIKKTVIHKALDFFEVVFLGQGLTVAGGSDYCKVAY